MMGFIDVISNMSKVTTFALHIGNFNADSVCPIDLLSA